MYKTNINLNLYKTFYDVAKYGSFSKASEYTFTSQPAISKTIKKLEKELGVQLLYRNTNWFQLTNKGKELLYFVEKSFNNLVIEEKNMLETKNLEKVNYLLEYLLILVLFFLFDKIIQFHNTYPKIEVTIITGSTSSLINLLDLILFMIK